MWHRHRAHALELLMEHGATRIPDLLLQENDEGLSALWLLASMELPGDPGQVHTINKGNVSTWGH